MNPIINILSQLFSVVPCFVIIVLFFEEYKSVKEKIAEAIEKDHHLSSEPEVSDSSTEEEEEEEKTISTQGEGKVN